MKSIFNISILTILFSVSAITHAQTHYQEIIRYKNNTIQTIYTYNNQDILDGETVHFYPNEKVKTVINFVSGKANGIVQSYYYNGNLESSGIIINDMAEGLFEYYHENGAPKHKITYLNNKIVSIKDCTNSRNSELYCGTVNNGNGFINIYDKKGKLVAKDIIKDGKMVKREAVN